ncbi:Folate-binding protein YgfZ [Candidatus Cyrtobacter comes]|uniref:Folate-binding protein YgfZ n=1 Tax=Candidatus Cyrtobacter comes TaxID=675776 RepID=A0ABU5LA40_9RICK|nr:hypothetical protein [Candidatus Cyrtobacter comes]MDZ5762714.1 Folate-binding protein YgfZ [Candidatus Cyrtobacter comes]
MNISTLETRGVISVTGSEAGSFLNKILTNNVPTEKGILIYALLLNPQGKVLYDFFIEKSADDRFILDVPAAYINEIIAKLDIYKLSLNLLIKIEDFSITVSDYAYCQSSLSDPRFSGCYRTLDAHTYNSNIEWYNILRINSIIPEHTVDFEPREFFPTHMSMHKFGSINYNKGCYVGQEVIARMTHRGNIMKCLYLVELKEEVKELTCRDVIYEGLTIGNLLSYHKNFGIAILRIEESNKIIQNSGHASVSRVRLRILKCL